MNFRSVAFAVAAVLSLSSGALQAQDFGPEPPGPEPLGSHQEHFLPSIGARVSWISDAGFDPFATDDVLAQVTVGFSRTLIVIGDLSLAADIHYDYGARKATARGLATDLEVHRVSLGPELRYHVLPFLFGFSRLSPALLHNDAELEDDVTDVRLYAQKWAFGLDATLGAAVELYGMKSGSSRKPRIWGMVEGGYGFGAPTKLSFAPDEDASAPLRLAAVELGELSISGPLMRVAAGVSF